jgi:hypothetical protein
LTNGAVSDDRLLVESLLANLPHAGHIESREYFAKARMMLYDPAATAAMVLKKSKAKALRWWRG